MDITTSVALVTGANRGIGREFARILVERGATVYATARRPESIDLEGVRTLQLDITDPASVAAAAAAAPDVTLLINNAGVTTGSDLVMGDLEKIKLELDTHFWGTLSMTRAFAPLLAANGGGAIANVLSALSWFSVPGAGAYHVAKAAEWALTSSTRSELAGQGTTVTSVHLGAADTDMMSGYDGPMVTTTAVVEAALAGIEAGTAEVLVDDWSRFIKSGLTGTPEEFSAGIRAALAG